MACVEVIAYWSKTKKKVVRPADPEMVTKRKEGAVALAKWKRK